MRKVRINGLPKAQDGLTWAEYLQRIGVTDKDMLNISQDVIDRAAHRRPEDYDSGYFTSQHVHIDRIPEAFKPREINGKIDIKNDAYNDLLDNLIYDYYDLYPLSNDGSRIITPNVLRTTSTMDPRYNISEQEYDKLREQENLSSDLNSKYIDIYLNREKNTEKPDHKDYKTFGKDYRDVPVQWVDARPKQKLKGIPNTILERLDERDMFRKPVLYDDKILGQQDIPLLGTDWMRSRKSKLPPIPHYNPAIYPKPSYSIQEANPVLSGIPNYGSSFTINGQDYTIAQPDQNYIQNQFYGIPATAMPGPSAENIFVDNPDSTWVQNYKNKMGLYDLTQQNLARLAEYDPNYRIISEPVYDDGEKIAELENQYINDPNVGFYQIANEANYREPCIGCNVLQGSTSSSDASNYYHTYDVQYPQYGIFKKEDLEPKPRYYIERSREYGNPGVAHIYRADLTDPTNPHNRDYLGAVLADEWLSGDALENFYRSGYQYREPIDYEALKDGRRVWKAGTENPDELEPYAILDQRAKEPAERGARELYKKRMQEISDMELGDPETESRRKQYVKEKLGMLNNYIDNLNAPRKRGRHYSGPSFKDGGSLPKAQYGNPPFFFKYTEDNDDISMPWWDASKGNVGQGSSKQNEVSNIEKIIQDQLRKDIRKAPRSEQIRYAVNQLKYMDPNYSPNLETLMNMTAWMENDYGTNPDAYGRDYTNSFMSLDDPAIDAIYIPRGQNTYNRSQRNVLDNLKKYGYTNRDALVKALRNEDPIAAMLAARATYYLSPDPLPDMSNPEAVFKYFAKNYNHYGYRKHKSDEEAYAKFLKGWEKYGKKSSTSKSKMVNGGDISIPDLRRVKIKSIPKNWKSQ